MTDFIKGQRVRYTGNISHALKDKVGTVVDPNDDNGWVNVQFDGETMSSLCFPHSLSVEVAHPDLITIGRTGPDWGPDIADGFYAQRGIEGQFAFGRTEEEALSKLLAAENEDKAEQKHVSQQDG